ncbi:unnamed protein product [Parnassius apollo]|uniref:(apollo) hypothetical protein n=1 Tax=Parnassius apollo TaxID=110799 RepID=A0A8S3XV81_PARAO|nr:unnamed protein product [Parnassius apollo]
MSNNWNANNRDRRGRSGPNWGGRGGHGGRGRGGRGGNRGSWPRPNFYDQQMGAFGDQRGGGGNRNNFGDRYPNRQWQNRPNRDTPGKRLSEEDIGVTEYMSEHEGFNGIIKCRYSDFQVSEINEKGEIAKLTNLSPPELPEDAINEDEDLLLSKYNAEILPIETWDRINALSINPQPTDEIVEVDVTGMTKEQRTKIHDAVKRAFGKSIVGSTVAVDDKKFVRFQKFRKGVRRDNRVKWVWPGEYVYFIVHKENCDTMDAAARLADRLKMNMHPSLMGYAGSKDRRAKTSQWFSLRKVDPRRIASAARDLPNLHVGNFSFNNVNLKLGMLKGNRFRIALRNVTASDEVISVACEKLKTLGFVNYYGLQRFGTRMEIPTYEIGLKLLQANYREAIRYILDDRCGRGGPNEMRLERALQKNPRDLLGALDKLARNQRILYLHAYQSLQWNRCVSRRLRLFGHVPAVGDLVPLTPLQVNIEDEDDAESDVEEKEDKTLEENVDQINDAIKPTTDDTDDNQEPDKKLENTTEKKGQIKNVPKPKVPVKVLTEQDVQSGRYTIFDVVMPVPGYNIEYPPNMVEYYKELLEKDNLKIDMRHKNKSFSMAGAYRHVVVRPRDVCWRVVRYDEPYCDLLLSDLQELRGDTTTGEKEDGKFKAFLLTMSLPASSYATMALRELLKVDTSNDNQAQQNNYFKSKSKVASDKANDKQGKKDEKGEMEDEKVDEKEDEKEGEKEDMNVDEGNNDELKQDDVNEQDETEDESRAEKRKIEENEEGDANAKKQKRDDDVTENVESGK